MTRRRALAALTLAIALGLALGGCRKPRQRANTKAQQRQIEAAVLDAEPKPQHPVGAILDGKIELIGVDLDKSEARQGQTIKVTWYWRCIEPAEGGWKVFVHFEGPGFRSGHDHHPVGELYPIAQWKKGEIIKSEQTIPVADKFPNGTAHIYAGVFDDEAWRERQQNVRMSVTNPKDVKTGLTDDGRIIAATIKIGKNVATPSYTAHKVTEPIVLDGKLDDAGWQGVAPTKPFVAPNGGALPAKQRVDARIAWDDQFLYVGFVCPDSDIVSDRKGRDSKIWEQDAVEIYLDPGADGKDYLELQVSPTGEIFDAHFSTHRAPRWEEASKRFTMTGLVARVDATGTVNQRGDKDTRWTAEVRIPFAEIPGISKAPVGEKWGFNLYRIGFAGETFMAAWTAVGGDFHNTADFGRLSFSASPPRSRGRRVPPRVRVVPPPEPAPAPEGEGAAKPDEAEGAAKPAEGEGAAKPAEGEGAPAEGGTPAP